MKSLAFCLTGALFIAGTTPATSQERPDSTTVQELERRIEALSREVESLRLGSAPPPVADEGTPGFGPAASKVYQTESGVSIGGYGEVLYENYGSELEDGSPATKPTGLDALRAIIYVGYKFNDRLLFNSEIEFEHGSTGQAGSASAEFAYIDYRLRDSFGIRGGLLLSPMGFVNELHEPPIFLGTERPLTENRIIPTTWRESGLGVFGTIGNFDYRAYLMNGLDGVGGGSSKAKGFGAKGLRGGRQKGSKALAEDMAVVARIDYTGILGLLVGGSVYRGGSDQGRTLSDRELDVATTIWEVHGDYSARGLFLRGLFARATLKDVAALNALRELEGADGIGKAMEGWYVQAGYNVLRNTDTSHELIPFIRYESVNTQSAIAPGFAASPANDFEVTSIGFSWKPIANVVGKIDYQIHANRANTGLNQFNVALGYLF